MTTHEYDNPATQSEKREVLQNDTMYSRQANAIPDEGGRYARITPSKLIGSESSPQYPKLAASSPWHHEALPNEEPLGIAVDEMPPLEVPAPNPTTATNPTAVEVDRAGASSPKDGGPTASSPASLGSGSPSVGFPSTLKRRI
jgi:hypothetical protein